MRMSYVPMCAKGLGGSRRGSPLSLLLVFLKAVLLKGIQEEKEARDWDTLLEIRVIDDLGGFHHLAPLERGPWVFLCYETVLLCGQNDDDACALLPNVDGLEVVCHVVGIGAFHGVAVSDGDHHGEALVSYSTLESPLGGDFMVKC